MIPFESIYQTYFSDVYRYLLRLTGGDQPLSEDLTSETFLKAMDAIGTFRGQCELRVWLCQIAKNCYLSELRRQKKTSPTPIDELPEPTDPMNLEAALLTADTAETTYALLHQLKEPYKEVFMLRTLGELSFKQIGALFGKSENWACVTYHRARRTLRERLEELT